MADLTLILLFIFVLIFFLLTGVPVPFAIGLATLALMILPFGPPLDLDILGSRMFRGINSFTILAVPFFLLAGRLMNESGATEPLFEFARAIVGGLRAATGQVNIVASMIFAGMSGLALADAAGLGEIEYRAMQDEGYEEGFSVAVTGSSAIIGPIIPPSVPVIIYAILAGESIGEMFIAGIVPGLLLGVTLCLSVAIYARINDYPVGKPRTFSRLWNTFKDAIPALMVPIIIVGGIISGIFTATESGAIAAVYALLIGFYWYGELSLSNTYGVFRSTAVDSAALVLIIAIANAYGFLVVTAGIPQALVSVITEATTSTVMIILALVVMLLIIGMVLEMIAAITVFVPVLLPVMDMAGIDPVHFGIVMILTLMVGALTPPFGIIIFVLERITGVDFERIVRSLIPFYLPILVVVLLVAVFPSLSTWLPNAI